MSKKNKSALTLVEISIGIILSCLVLAAVIGTMRAGLRGSTKGMAHQANMETALILMSQIEYDLLRAVEITYPENDCTDEIANWRMNYTGNDDETVIAKVCYTSEKNKVIRTVELENGDIVERNTFASEQSVDLLLFTKYHGKGSKHGLFVELTIASKNAKVNDNQEPFSLKRFFIIRN